MIKERWLYETLSNPTEEELRQAGKNGWEVYATDGYTYKIKRKTK